MFLALTYIFNLHFSQEVPIVLSHVFRLPYHVLGHMNPFVCLNNEAVKPLTDI